MLVSFIVKFVLYLSLNCEKNEKNQKAGLSVNVDLTRKISNAICLWTSRCFGALFCWHCPTTSHSKTPHPMNRAMRWYTVVTLLYDLCYFIYLFALVIGLAIFDYNWDGWEQIMNIPTTLQHSIFIFYQSLSFFLESFSITCVDSFPKWRVLPIFFLKNGPIPASFCLFSSFLIDTNQI